MNIQKTVLSGLCILLINCGLKVIDRTDPPEVFGKSVYIYHADRGLRCFMLKDKPNEVILTGPATCRKLDLLNHVITALPYDYLENNQNTVLMPINIQANHSKREKYLEIEFNGKFSKQNRTFFVGQGVIPTGFQSNELNVFSGEVYIKINHKIIFKQHQKNSTLGVAISVFPEFCLLIYDYPDINNPLGSNLYLIQLDSIES